MYINREVLVPRPSVADAITILLSSRDTRVIAVRYAVTASDTSYFVQITVLYIVCSQTDNNVIRCQCVQYGGRYQ